MKALPTSPPFNFDYVSGGAGKEWLLSDFFNFVDDCKWQVVRYIPITTGANSFPWFTNSDQCTGTDAANGDKSDASASWGIQYGSLTYDLIMFSTGAYKDKQWIIMEKNELAKCTTDPNNCIAFGNCASTDNWYK